MTTDPGAQGRLDNYKRAALRWVNDQRRELGKPLLAELPLGDRMSNASCSLARALDATVTTYFMFGADNEPVSLPPDVSAFVQQFDLHRYPELEL